MQELLTGIWEKHRLTVLFITHDVEEAVYLSDRVAVMTNRPGRIKKVVDIDLPRPRHYDIVSSPEFQRLHRTVLDAIRGRVARGRLATGSVGMSPEDYAKHDASALAALIRAGEVTRAEVLQAAVARIRKRTPKSTPLSIFMRNR